MRRLAVSEFLLLGATGLSGIAWIASFSPYLFIIQFGASSITLSGGMFRLAHYTIPVSQRINYPRPTSRIDITNKIDAYTEIKGGLSSPASLGFFIPRWRAFQPQFGNAPRIGAWNLDFPLGTSFVASMIVTIVCRKRHGRKRSQLRYIVGKCGRCNYDLLGNESGICPECGTPIPESYKCRVIRSKKMI
jgi:hypothetical protein